MSTILRISVTYSPLRFFAFLGISIFLLGILVGVRFLFFLASGEGDGHIQSLILASLLMSIGFVTAITGGHSRPCVRKPQIAGKDRRSGSPS